MDRTETHFQKHKNVSFNTCFFFFFYKNFKMKINHPKTFIQHQFLWLKTKLEQLEQLTPIF